MNRIKRPRYRSGALNIIECQRSGVRIFSELVALQYHGAFAARSQRTRVWPAREWSTTGCARVSANRRRGKRAIGDRAVVCDNWRTVELLHLWLLRLTLLVGPTDYSVSTQIPSQCSPGACSQLTTLQRHGARRAGLNGSRALAHHSWR